MGLAYFCGERSVEEGRAASTYSTDDGSTYIHAPFRQRVVIGILIGCKDGQNIAEIVPHGDGHDVADYNSGNAGGIIRGVYCGGDKLFENSRLRVCSRVFLFEAFDRDF